MGRRSRSLTWIAGASWAALVLLTYYRAAWRISLSVLEGGVPPAVPAATLPTLVIGAPVAALLAARFGWIVMTRRRARAALVAVAWLLAAMAGVAVAWARLEGTPSHLALPWAGEAVRRAARAFAGAGIVIASAWTLGGLVLRLIGWPPEPRPDRSSARPAERILFRIAIGFGAVSYVSLGLAALGAYRPMTVVPLLSGLAALGAIVWWRQRPVEWRVPALPRGSDLLWTAVGGLALAVALVAALAPEVEYDALWYHLWLPRLWLEHGRPVDVLTEYISLYPLTWELLYGDALAIGGPVAAKLLHFACLPLTALAVWLLARRFFRPVSPWLASAVFVTIPTVAWEAGTAYIDVALALYVTLGLYALLHFVDDRRREWLWLAALSLGIAVAIKHLGLVVLALAASGLFVQRLRRTGDPWRSLAAPLALVLTAFVLALPWYWRAWTASGNPFFPELYKVFGAWPAARWDAATERGLDAFKARFGFPRTPLSLALLPWNVTQHGAAFGGCLGPILLVALPWIVGRLPRRTATRWLLLVVVGYVAVWASPVSSFQLRFLVPVLPAASVLCALGLRRMFASLAGSGAGLRVAHTALAIVLLLDLPPFIRIHEGDRAGWGGWLTHVQRTVPLAVAVGRQSEDTYLRENVPSYGAWRYLSTASPATSVVLDMGGGDNFYATRPRISADATVARGVWAHGDGGARTVIDTFAGLGLTHVLVDRASSRRMAAEGAALASDAFRGQNLQLEYDDGQAAAYRVLPPRSTASVRALRPSCRSTSSGW